MNEQIRVPKVRVISETGEQLGVLSTRDALERARSVGLDLMEVAPKESPPVCKIMDYGKFKYQQQKKEHQARKKQHIHEMKEVRMRPKTDVHDVQIKLDRARDFLEDGSKVQFTMLYRGRENLHQDRGREIFKTIIEKLDDVAKVERETRMEGRRMIMILTPKVKKLVSSGHKPSHPEKSALPKSTPPAEAEHEPEKAEQPEQAEAQPAGNNDGSNAIL